MPITAMAGSGVRGVNGLMRVTGAWTGLLTDWLDREGLSAPRLRAQLARFAPDDVVPIAAWREALAQAAALRPNVPALGLQIGAGVQPRHLGVLGYLVAASDNLGEAMRVYLAYERLFYGANLAQLSWHGDEVEIAWPPAEQGPMFNEVSIGALVTFMSRQVDDPPRPLRISFVHEADPPTRACYEAFFACPVGFGDTHTRVRIPVAYMQIPMRHPEPGLRVLLDGQAEALLRALPDPGDFDQAVQRLLLRVLPEGGVSVHRLAKMMNQSARTLQRRLGDHGLTWQMLLDRTREQLARQYLRDPALSVCEVAMMLGYSDQSAFTKAFKRWTADTPQAWRSRGIR